MAKMKRLLFFSLLAGGFTPLSEAQNLPASVTLPASVKPKGEVNVENYGQAKFILNGTSELVRGKLFTAFLDHSALASDPKAALPLIAAALVKGGWQIIVLDAPRNPPLATAKLSKDAQESWLQIEAWGKESRLVMIERGEPAVRLDLVAPVDGVAEVPQTADFPFLKAFPGSKLTQTRKDARPMMAALMRIYRQPLWSAPCSI